MPRKTGLDYYEHFLGMTNDEKLVELRMNYGSVAIDIWLTLLDMIYEDKGYYIEYGDDKKKNRVIWKILGIIRGKYSPTAETVTAIIEDLAACGLFSGDLFKSGILSSKRIQKQFYKATVERKAVDIIPEYWLLDFEEMQELSKVHPYIKSYGNRPISNSNRPISSDNQPNCSQSRVEKSREEYSRVEREYGCAASPAPDNQQSFNSLGEYKNVRLTDEQLQTLKSKHGEFLTKAYIDILSRYMQAHNKNYSDHEATISLWINQDREKGKLPVEKNYSFDLSEYEALVNNFGDDDI